MARALTPSNLARVYLLAKDHVVRSGFGAEIDWQENLSFQNIAETEFLREMAWVVLSAGFRESVLRRRFVLISEAFLQWRSSDAICADHAGCRYRALRAFNHPPKIDAILQTAEATSKVGFSELKQRIERRGVSFLMQFPFVGPVTAFHLAKNLGLSVVKPDRHLVRTANAAGYDCPASMCETIAKIVADKVSVVDLVIWRYATLNPDYEAFFSRKQNVFPPCSLNHATGIE